MHITHSKYVIERVSDTQSLLVQYGTGDSPFGKCFIAWRQDGAICNLSFIDGKDESRNLKVLVEDWPQYQKDITEAQKVIDKVFSSEPASGVLAMKGSALQLKVWEALLSIPYGKTLSYSEVAALISKPKAVRAVASCIAQNTISYIVPCHRVLRKSGEVGEYRWSSARKKAMLLHESKYAN